MEKHIETEFVEALGMILQNDGLPRIAGRILGIFVLHGGPFGFPELCEKLQVSRGSISTNTRLLVDLGAIERVGVPGERQDYFRLSDKPYEQLIERWISRCRRSQEIISRSADALSSADQDSRSRMEDLHGFYTAMARASEGALSELRDNSATLNKNDTSVMVGE